MVYKMSGMYNIWFPRFVYKMSGIFADYFVPNYMANGLYTAIFWNSTHTKRKYEL